MDQYILYNNYMYNHYSTLLYMYMYDYNYMYMYMPTGLLIN